MNAAEIREVQRKFNEMVNSSVVSPEMKGLNAVTTTAWAQLEIAAQLAELNEKLGEVSVDPYGYLLVKNYIEGSNVT